MRLSTTSNVPIGNTITWYLYPGTPRERSGNISRGKQTLHPLSRGTPAPEKPDVDSYITVTAPQDIRPYVCPVCGGRGTVPRGFYNYLAASTTDTIPEMCGPSLETKLCRSCAGTGIVWR